jgi:ornithine cyclodeaminase/alanine dehydrogenase-like protein (mu-crystallin family)
VLGGWVLAASLALVERIHVTWLISDREVRALCDMGRLIDAVEDGLRQEAKGCGAVLPQRLNLSHEDTFLRVMPVLLPEAGLMGLKFFQGSLARGVRYVVAVSSLETGEVMAVLDSAYLTAARTGATSGVATRLMSREDSHSVGLIGSGLEAETNVEAVCAVRPISSVKVYSRSAQRREGFAARMGDRLGIEVTAVGSPAEAVAGTDIVVVATNTGVGGPTALAGADLESGQHVVSIGSTTLALREIDVETFRRAHAVVFDADFAQVCVESGDVAALVGGLPGWAQARSLDQLLVGSTAARRSPDEITLFKSVGTAAQDLIAASFIVQEARRRGAGVEVDEIAQPKQF